VDTPGWLRRAEAWLDGSGRTWLRRIVVALVGAAALIGLAFLPRWWSHRVAHQVNGSMTVGIMLGLFYGFVFTVLPLVTVVRAFRKRRPWKVWASLAVLAIVLAGPNLLTLGIVVGSGHGAHAGERTLDVDAPGFRGASLAGALCGAFAVAAVEYLLVSRRWSRRRLDAARRSG
jgi:hypothetical protein